jgi:outer membrane protein OmpA-like peptidoglycan-associated protein
MQFKSGIIFTSNRPGGFGGYDIYTMGAEESEKQISFIVKDKKDGKPISTEIKISAQSGNDKQEKKRHEITKKSDGNGRCSVKAREGIDNLDVRITEKGYLPYFNKFELKNYDGKPLVIELVPIEESASFDIHAIHFDYNSARIKNESYDFLDELVLYLKKNESLRLEIIGHTDLNGTDSYNMKLSEKRAASVRDYLVGKGVDGGRFSVKGEGMRKPLVNKKGKGFDEKNRRTEFRVIGK